MSTPEKIVQLMVKGVIEIFLIGLMLGILILPFYAAFHFLVKYW